MEYEGSCHTDPRINGSQAREEMFQFEQTVQVPEFLVYTQRKPQPKKDRPTILPQCQPKSLEEVSLGNVGNPNLVLPFVSSQPLFPSSNNTPIDYDLPMAIRGV
jgi:hypothetical protein